MISDTLKVKNTSNTELQDQIVDELKKNGYFAEVTSSIINKIEISISKRTLKTHIIIDRNQHTPNLLTLKVDSSINQTNIKLANYRNKQSQKGKKKDNSFFRLYIYFFIISFLGSIIYFLLELFFPSTNQKIAFLTTIMALVVMFFIGRNHIGDINRANLETFDKKVFDLIHANLMNSQSDQTEKCWNCFKDKLFEEQFCSNCGK